MAAEMGLSFRGAANVDAVLPRISAAVAERAKKDNPNIDLGTSENWLIRDELINLCREAIQERLLAKVTFLNPKTFVVNGVVASFVSGRFWRGFRTPRSPLWVLQPVF